MWINKLERKFGRMGIPNLALYIVIGMLVVYIFDYIMALKGGGYMTASLSSHLIFSRDLVMQGQVWRLITFLLVPPGQSPVMMLLFLYFTYFVGRNLENAWGSFRFTLYYLLGTAGALVGGFLVGFTTNAYLNLSLFFAFACLFPETKVLLFFFIPIKVKWLGLLDAAFFLYEIVRNLVSGYWGMSVIALLAIVNFLIFFGPGFISGLKSRAGYRKSRRDFQQKMNNTWRNIQTV